MEVDNVCNHSKRCSRRMFYSTLFSYSSMPDTVVEDGEGGNAPVTEVEVNMMKEWVVLSRASTVSLGRLTLSSLPSDEKERRNVMKDNHRLSLFSRDVGGDALAYIRCHRVLPYSCDCNDLRCICGEESMLSYIYNTKTHFVLAVGTTCVKTVRMASLNYKRCIECNEYIRAYTTRNMGMCTECSKSTKLRTGSMSGKDVHVVAKSDYDPSTDESISLIDSMRIKEARDRLCSKCNGGLHYGLRGEGNAGWMEERLCAKCIFRNKITLTTGEDALTIALFDPYRPFASAMKEGKTVANRDLSLLMYIHSLYKACYFSAGHSPVGFGKYSIKSIGEVVEKQPEYIKWCREKCDNPSPQMNALLAYADLRERYLAVKGWPE